MKLLVSAILLLMVITACAQQDAAAFQPPVSYEAQRYEAGWNKNPFTLKTAPQVVESVSFARDLAIASYFGDYADPTIVIVNTKTNERIRLQQNQPSATGMRLGKVTLGSSRTDIMVEVILGSESAIVRYDDGYVKQMAAAEMTKTPAVQQQTRQQPGMPSKIPLPQNPPQPDRGTSPGTTSATAQAASAHPPRPGFVRPSGVRNPAGLPAATGGATAGAAPSVPLGSQSTRAKAAPAVPLRRRLVGPVPSATPITP